MTDSRLTLDALRSKLELKLAMAREDGVSVDATRVYEAFLADLREQAQLSLRNRLILDAIIEAENIEVSDEDMSGALQSLAARSEDPAGYLRAFQESGRGLALASDILRNRALDAILSNANPVDEDGNALDLSLKVNEVEAEIVDDEDVVTAEEEEE